MCVCVSERETERASQHWSPERKRSGERKRPTFHPPRSGTICVQPDKHCHCFGGNLGETAERRGGARMCLSEHYGAENETSSSSSSTFDMMVALTRFFLPWVLHIWMSGTNPLQTPRAWFWGTHKWAISAALLADGVSRTVGSVLVFGSPLHRGIVRRSLRQSSWDGYSVCSGLFWGERWWSVGVAPADGARPGLGCILQSCSGRWLSFYYG